MGKLVFLSRHGGSLQGIVEVGMNEIWFSSSRKYSLLGYIIHFAHYHCYLNICCCLEKWVLSSSSVCSCEFFNIFLLNFVLTLNWWNTTLNSVQWYVLVRVSVIHFSVYVWGRGSISSDDQFKLTVILASGILFSLYFSQPIILTLYHPLYTFFLSVFAYPINSSLSCPKFVHFAFCFSLSPNKDARVSLSSFFKL